MMKFLALSLSEVVFIMLINVKMPTIVGILTFQSRINFVLSRVEHGKSFITSGPDIYCDAHTLAQWIRISEILAWVRNIFLTHQIGISVVFTHVRYLYLTYPYQP